MNYEDRFSIFIQSDQINISRGTSATIQGIEYILALAKV